MHTYVINLDRSTARMQDFRRENAHLPEILRFSAVDGATADRLTLIADGIVAPDLQYSNGALGCALSHIFFWDAAVSSGEEITVAEDDAIFHRDFSDRSKCLMEDLPGDWDLVMWGWNFDSILLFDMMPGVSPCLSMFNQDDLRRGIASFSTLAFSPRHYRLLRCFGTVCYTVSPGGAQKLKSMCLPLRPMTVEFPLVNPSFPNNGIDIAMNAAYPAINAFVSFPPLVVTRNDHGISTVLADEGQAK